MAIVAASGELDLTGVDDLLNQVDWVLTRRPVVVALDLRALSFIDSSGLHAIVIADERCRARGRRFMVIRRECDERQVDHLLSACGMDTYFDTVSEPDQLADGEFTSAPPV